jgi:catechol-2,3-dioxygenase
MNDASDPRNLECGREHHDKSKAGTVALGHIGLTVSDLDVSEGFYQEVLGLRVVDESLQFPSRYASMARDGKTVLTLWEHTAGRSRSAGPVCTISRLKRIRWKR